MSWREFLLRKAGYEREQLREWERTRVVAYWSGVDGGFDGTKTKIEKFMPLSSDESKPKQGVSSTAKERFKKMQKEYYNKVKAKDGE